MSRSIVVRNTVWEYRVGKNFVVAKSKSTGEGKRAQLTEVTGMDWNSIQRGQYKHTFHVTPAQIDRWLAST